MRRILRWRLALAASATGVVLVAWAARPDPVQAEGSAPAPAEAAADPAAPPAAEAPAPAEAAPAEEAPAPAEAAPAEGPPALPEDSGPAGAPEGAAAPAPAPAAPSVAEDGSVDDPDWPPPDAPPLPPEGSEVGSVDDFVEPLEPYGEWWDLEGYGRVFSPNPVYVGTDWRPYTYGHWEETDYGWTWVSDFDWGWAPFHYGRWVACDHVTGWAWVPGTVWSPAWVHWRWGGGYVGWATYGKHRGFRGWNFVPANRFGSPKPYRHFIPANRKRRAFVRANRRTPRARFSSPKVGLTGGPSPRALRRMGLGYVPRSYARHLRPLWAPAVVRQRVRQRLAEQRRLQRAGRRTAVARQVARDPGARQALRTYGPQGHRYGSAGTRHRWTAPRGGLGYGYRRRYARRHSYYRPPRAYAPRPSYPVRRYAPRPYASRPPATRVYRPQASAPRRSYAPRFSRPAPAFRAAPSLHFGGFRRR